MAVNLITFIEGMAEAITAERQASERQSEFLRALFEMRDAGVINQIDVTNAIHTAFCVAEERCYLVVQTQVSIAV